MGICQLQEKAHIKCPLRPQRSGDPHKVKHILVSTKGPQLPTRQSILMQFLKGHAEAPTVRIFFLSGSDWRSVGKRTGHRNQHGKTFRGNSPSSSTSPPSSSSSTISIYQSIRPMYSFIRPSIHQSSYSRIFCPCLFLLCLFFLVQLQNRGWQCMPGMQGAT